MHLTENFSKWSFGFIHQWNVVRSLLHHVLCSVRSAREKHPSSPFFPQRSHGVGRRNFAIRTLCVWSLLSAGAGYKPGISLNHRILMQENWTPESFSLTLILKMRELSWRHKPLGCHTVRWDGGGAERRTRLPPPPCLISCLLRGKCHDIVAHSHDWMTLSDKWITFLLILFPLGDCAWSLLTDEALPAGWWAHGHAACHLSPHHGNLPEQHQGPWACLVQWRCAPELDSAVGICA